MRRPAGLVALALVVTMTAPVSAGAGEDEVLDMYRATAHPAVVERLVREGYDVAATRPGPGGRVEIDLVLAPGESRRLRAGGLHLEVWRNREGRRVSEIVRAQAQGGYTVWRSWDEEGGIADELAGLARRYPDLAEHQVIGRSREGRDLVALRVTAGAASVPDGTRPAVLHVSAQHAREWISVEVNRRLLRSYLEGYGLDPEVTRLLDTTELWFVVVANPDGYQVTFDSYRLWRKNTRDNDGDGQLGADDGVDLNRNFPAHFAHDPEGSSGRPAAGTYRGPTPASEPETRALMELMERVDFAFAVNYHSFGRLLLYPFGWQDHLPSADQPIYEALAGTPALPAIPGYRPMLSSDLYITNGETMGWAHDGAGTLAFTPELGEGVPGNGFAFPDNEALVHQEYELNRLFALDLARSAATPASPTSHLGNRAPALVADPFSVSHAARQTVQARAARHLGEVTLHYRVADGPTRVAPTVEWDGGRRYGSSGDVHYRLVRGEVTGADPGEEVEVWFEAGPGSGETERTRTAPFTYTVAVGAPRRVLVVAGGDLDPRVSVPARAESADPGPVLDALEGAGITADVYDVEGHDRRPPHPLGVLGHYEAVIWVTPDRSSTIMPETVSRLAREESLAARDYLNEGGRLLYLGRDAGRPYAEGAEYGRLADRPCLSPDRAEDGCATLSDDLFQYWLGAFDRSEVDRDPQRVDGVAPPFEGISFALRSGAGAGRPGAFEPVTEALDPGAYPHLEGRAAARYARAVGETRAAVAAVSTPSSLLLGFSLEDVTDAGARTELIGRALDHLLRTSPGPGGPGQPP